MKTLQCEDASVLGAAILAACGVGAYRSPEEAASVMVQVKDVFEPDQSSYNVYQEKLLLYRDLYPRLKELNHRLR
ncbi:MAG: hypothetical protein ABDK92_01015 [Atribacterota bacterium]